MSDFANDTLAWWLTLEVLRGLHRIDLAVLDIPSAAESLAADNVSSGRQPGSDWDTRVVFNLFRLAAIALGIARRPEEGIASNPEAAALGRMATTIADAGWRAATGVG